MARIELKPGIVNYPMPVVLVGTSLAGSDDFMTVAWMSMVSHTPPRVAVSLGPHLTRDRIHETGAFSICVPSAKDLVDVDWCGIVSGAKVDKSKAFDVFRGHTGVPLIESCGLNVECRLDHVDANESNETFVGDVVAIYADEAVLTDGKVDLEKLDPLVLSQLDARYLTLGTVAGHAWRDGRRHEG